MAEESILLVEDQMELMEPVRCRLEAEGYRVRTAADGARGIELFVAECPDLVLLDLVIPRVDGLTVCRRIRAQSQVPILILSGKSEEADVVAALELGADDYVPKPFRINELLARIRALLRRAEGRRESAVGETSTAREILKAGPVWIDVRRCEVRVRGERVPLTPTEYRMLVELARRGGEVVTRDELLATVWGYDGYDAGLVNTHVKRLRARIEENPAEPEIVLTVRGFGYRLAG